MKPAGEFKNLVIVKPTILMSYELKSQIMAFVNGINAQECQWFHTITRILNSKGDRAFYTFKEMLIPEQEVSSAYVESPEKGLLTLYNELKVTYGNEDGTYDKAKVNEIIGTMHVWAHSHVNMACSPSGTDEATFKQWVVQNEAQGLTTPVVMMIVNKKEDVYIRLYDPELGIYCENPSIEFIMPPVDLTYVQDAIQNKVKTRAIVTGFQGQVFTGNHRTSLPESRIITGVNEEKVLKITSPLVEAGKKLLDGISHRSIEEDLIRCARTNRCDSEALRIASTVNNSLKDNTDVFVFLLLLQADTSTLRKLVTNFKSIKIPSSTELLTSLGDEFFTNWCETPEIFYAFLAAAQDISGLTGTISSKMKNLEIILGTLTELETNSVHISRYEMTK